MMRKLLLPIMLLLLTSVSLRAQNTVCSARITVADSIVVSDSIDGLDSVRYLLQMLGFFAVVVLANFGGLSLGLPWWVVVIGAGVTSIAVMFGLRLASLKELVAILRSKEE